jgi:hypothetical protein
MVIVARQMIYQMNAGACCDDSPPTIFTKKVKIKKKRERKYVIFHQKVTSEIDALVKRKRDIFLFLFLPKLTMHYYNTKLKTTIQTSIIVISIMEWKTPSFFSLFFSLIG